MMRTLECVKCGEQAVYDSWPDEGAGSEEVLDALIRQDLWTFDGLDDVCPTCSGGGDD